MGSKTGNRIGIVPDTAAAFVRASVGDSGDTVVVFPASRVWNVSPRQGRLGRIPSGAGLARGGRGVDQLCWWLEMK